MNGPVWTHVWVGTEEFKDKDWFKKKISEIRKRYDIRPSQDVVIMKVNPKKKRLDLPVARWGIKGETFDREKMDVVEIDAVNTRQEKLLRWNFWRGPLKRGRCVIPVNAFYEWQDREDSISRLPWEIRRKGHKMIYMAGIYRNTAKNEFAKEKLQASIITQPGNDLMRWIHNHGGNKGRAPVFLDEDVVPLWLDPKLTDAEKAFGLLRTIQDGEWEARPLKSIGNDETHQPMRPLPKAKFIDKPDPKFSLGPPISPADRKEALRKIAAKKRAAAKKKQAPKKTIKVKKKTTGKKTGSARVKSVDI